MRVARVEGWWDVTCVQCVCVWRRRLDREAAAVLSPPPLFLLLLPLPTTTTTITTTLFCSISFITVSWLRNWAIVRVLDLEGHQKLGCGFVLQCVTNGLTKSHHPRPASLTQTIGILQEITTKQNFVILFFSQTFSSCMTLIQFPAFFRFVGKSGSHASIYHIPVAINVQFVALLWLETLNENLITHNYHLALKKKKKHHPVYWLKKRLHIRLISFMPWTIQDFLFSLLTIHSLFTLRSKQTVTFFFFCCLGIHILTLDVSNFESTSAFVRT